MKKARFTESQIVSILKLADSGMKIDEICRQNGISNATYYNWKSKYGGMEAADIKRLKELEDENARLKKTVCGSQPGKSCDEGAFCKKGLVMAEKKDLRSGINSGRFIGHSRLSVSFTAQNLFLPDKYRLEN